MMNYWHSNGKDCSSSLSLQTQQLVKSQSKNLSAHLLKCWASVLRSRYQKIHSCASHSSQKGFLLFLQIQTEKQILHNKQRIHRILDQMICHGGKVIETRPSHIHLSEWFSAAHIFQILITNICSCLYIACGLLWNTQFCYQSYSFIESDSVKSIFGFVVQRWMSSSKKEVHSYSSQTLCISLSRDRFESIFHQRSGLAWKH